VYGSNYYTSGERDWDGLGDGKFYIRVKIIE
jgi:hypothetical protein